MLVYNNPKIRYVDMCKYIDDNIYSGNYDELKVFDYLCYISNMLASQHSMFKYVKDYEDFSVYMASRIYMRLTKETQFGDNPKLEKIKSVLNYAKKILYPTRFDFIKEHHPEELSKSTDEHTNVYDLKYYISRTTDELDKCDFNVCLNDTVNTIRKFFEDNTLYCNRTDFRFIYISCLLSFLSSITLKNVDIKRMREFKRESSITDSLLNSLYNKEADSVILYGLDPSMKPLITVLTRRIKRIISIDLSRTTHTYIPEYVNTQNLLLSDILEGEQN